VPPIDLAQALQCLPGLHCDVLRLRYAAGCNEDDIAAVLDLPVADVARLLREASDALGSAVALVPLALAFTARQ
jgi:DNA-directed RNA polymerase specialized sigma24 family protein